MTEIWTQFAWTGVPQAEGLPEWEAYNQESGAVMILDDTSYLAHHHDTELMNLLAPDYAWWPE